MFSVIYFCYFYIFRQDFNDFGVAEFAAAYSNNFPAYPNPCHFALAAAANAHHVHHHVHHGAAPNAGTPTSQTSTGNTIKKSSKQFHDVFSYFLLLCVVKLLNENFVKM